MLTLPSFCNTAQGGKKMQTQQPANYRLMLIVCVGEGGRSLAPVSTTCLRLEVAPSEKQQPDACFYSLPGPTQRGVML